MIHKYRSGRDGSENRKATEPDQRTVSRERQFAADMGARQ